MNESTKFRLAVARDHGFGEDTRMYSSCLVLGDVEVGKNTWIGPWTILDGSGGLQIGSNCSISAGVHIYSHDSIDWALSGGHADYPHDPVKIGDNTYIGPHAVICKGVTIGKGCVVGANSVVVDDVPDHVMIAGNPAVLKKYLDWHKRVGSELSMNEQLEMMR